VRLEETIEPFPDVDQPVDHVVHAGRRRRRRRRRVVAAEPRGRQSSTQVAAEQADRRLGVVGAQHPPEVVVQLEVRRRTAAGRLIHRAYDVRAAATSTTTASIIS